MLSQDEELARQLQEEENQKAKQGREVRRLKNGRYCHYLVTCTSLHCIYNVVGTVFNILSNDHYFTSLVH